MMKMFKYLLACAVVFVWGCKPSEQSTSNTITSQVTPSQNTSEAFSLSEKVFLHEELFLNRYLWNTQVPQNVDYDRFSNRQQMIDALKYKRYDRWSFVVTLDQYNAFINQTNSGFGIRFTPDLRVMQVHIGSPAWGVILRGDKIKQINEEVASVEALLEASKRTHIPTRFVVERNDTNVKITLAPKPYSYQSVSEKILYAGTQKVGYVRLDIFSENTVAELEHSFDRLKAENIDELVIDLRYNTGGLITTASNLLDNITGQFPLRRQAYIQTNDILSQRDAWMFEDVSDQDGNELRMRRVFFLVTNQSASASEMVIQALKPYLGECNVITIGTHTHGKPVGMSGYKYGSNVYFLINFIIKNDLGESVPFTGIAPTCEVNDDITKPQGDPDEKMLSAALYYIQNDRCPPSLFKHQNNTKILTKYNVLFYNQSQIYR